MFEVWMSDQKKYYCSCDCNYVCNFALFHKVSTELQRTVEGAKVVAVLSKHSIVVTSRLYTNIKIPSRYTTIETAQLWRSNCRVLMTHVATQTN